MPRARAMGVCSYRSRRCPVRGPRPGQVLLSPSRCSAGPPRQLRAAPASPRAERQRRWSLHPAPISAFSHFPPSPTLPFSPPSFSLCCLMGKKNNKKSSGRLTLSPSFSLPFETHQDRAGPAVSRQRRFQPRFSCVPR